MKTNSELIPFQIGENVLCYEPDPLLAKKLYIARIQNIKHVNINKNAQILQIPIYWVHFLGWKNSWDWHVEEKYLLKDTPQNRQLKKQIDIQLGIVKKTSIIKKKDSNNKFNKNIFIQPQELGFYIPQVINSINVIPIPDICMPTQIQAVLKIDEKLVGEKKIPLYIKADHPHENFSVANILKQFESHALFVHHNTNYNTNMFDHVATSNQMLMFQQYFAQYSYESSFSNSTKSYVCNNDNYVNAYTKNQPSEFQQKLSLISCAKLINPVTNESMLKEFVTGLDVWFNHIYEDRLLYLPEKEQAAISDNKLNHKNINYSIQNTIKFRVASHKTNPKAQMNGLFSNHQKINVSIDVTIFKCQVHFKVPVKTMKLNHINKRFKKYFMMRLAIFKYRTVPKSTRKNKDTENIAIEESQIPVNSLSKCFNTENHYSIKIRVQNRNHSNITYNSEHNTINVIESYTHKTGIIHLLRFLSMLPKLMNENSFHLLYPIVFAQQINLLLKYIETHLSSFLMHYVYVPIQTLQNLKHAPFSPVNSDEINKILNHKPKSNLSFKKRKNKLNSTRQSPIMNGGGLSKQKQRLKYYYIRKNGVNINALNTTSNKKQRINY